MVRTRRVDRLDRAMRIFAALLRFAESGEGDIKYQVVGDFMCLFRSVEVGGGDVGVEGGLHALL